MKVGSGLIDTNAGFLITICSSFAGWIELLYAGVPDISAKSRMDAVPAVSGKMVKGCDSGDSGAFQENDGDVETLRPSLMTLLMVTTPVSGAADTRASNVDARPTYMVVGATTERMRSGAK